MLLINKNFLDRLFQSIENAKFVFRDIVFCNRKE